MKSANGANLLPGMTASVTITVLQHHNVLLVPVNAINFARLASGGNGAKGSTAPISQQEADTGMNQARQMLRELERQDATLGQGKPGAGYGIEERKRGEDGGTAGGVGVT